MPACPRAFGTGSICPGLHVKVSFQLPRHCCLSLCGYSLGVSLQTPFPLWLIKTSGPTWLLVIFKSAVAGELFASLSNSLHTPARVASWHLGDKRLVSHSPDLASALFWVELAERCGEHTACPFSHITPSHHAPPLPQSSYTQKIGINCSVDLKF